MDKLILFKFRPADIQKLEFCASHEKCDWIARANFSSNVFSSNDFPSCDMQLKCLSPVADSLKNEIQALQRQVIKARMHE